MKARASAFSPKAWTCAPAAPKHRKAVVAETAQSGFSRPGAHRAQPGVSLSEALLTSPLALKWKPPPATLTASVRIAAVLSKPNGPKTPAMPTAMILTGPVGRQPAARLHEGAEAVLDSRP